MRKLSFLSVVILLIMMGSCKKQQTANKPTLSSNVTSYYMVPLQSQRIGQIYEAAANGTTTYKVYKGGCIVGEQVALSISGPYASVSSINTSDAFFDIITVSTTLGAATVNEKIFDNTNYAAVWNAMNLKINVSAVPTTLCNGESYVASITEITGIGNPYSIEQVHNFFVITMTYPEYIDQTKERNEISSYDQAFESYAQSPTTKTVPVWTDYIFYDWMTPSNTQTYKGKFVIVWSSTDNKYELYLTDPEYPVSSCLLPM